ncbi:hypothetical protein [Sphingomonas sp.]|uniref:hypothetical protein n=1 Tax=Sphingomonas sp. TaxID=28214 RepID=UPI002DD6B8BF|nr:hypothetical protein [Sphingomonas sp.]
MTPSTTLATLDAFIADLIASGTATAVLEAWSGGRVHAELVGSGTPAPADIRTMLGVGDDSPLGHRRVRLMRGDSLLSQADNWFVPDRLAPDMRVALDRSDTPFGAVIAPLQPRRETLACERLSGDPILMVRALVRGGNGQPLALVEERYAAAILARKPGLT